MDSSQRGGYGGERRHARDQEVDALGYGVSYLALQHALEKANLEITDMGLVEINEAFAAVTIRSMHMLGLDPDIVNVNGGSVAFGPPTGPSGTRLLGSLNKATPRRIHTKGPPPTSR